MLIAAPLALVLAIVLLWFSRGLFVGFVADRVPISWERSVGAALAQGLIEPQEVQDEDLQAATIALAGPLLAQLEDDWAGPDGIDLTLISDESIAALSAEACGCMKMLVDDTVEYCKTRKQFGVPIGKFQVLQHRMVDMFMEYEQCKSLLYRATLETVQSGAAAARTVHALKHFVGKTGIMIGENAVQLHGGMGMTEELRIGHYFKRLLVIDSQFGNSDYHLQKFAA